MRDPRDGSLLLIGRYRDAGDSRTGVSAGTRGRELALFRSTDDGRSFNKIRSWDKSDLYCGSTVLSIEGSALEVNKRRIEIMVSTEKFRPYPRQFTGFQKPGTGLWSIDTFGAANPDRLNPQESIAPLLASNDPAYLHLKDPNLSPGLHRGQSLLLYCAHPYSWSSSTSGSATLSAQSCISDGHDIFPRGSTWDVAASRHHLPPACTQSRRLRQAAFAIALFLRRRRMPAPARRTQKGGRPATWILLRGIGRTGLRLRP